MIGIRLTSNDAVVSANVVEERTCLLTVTERGFGKRSKVEEYPVHGRGAKGVISIKTTERNGRAVDHLQVRDEDEVVMITNNGKLIRTKVSSISILGRNTQGVKLMDLGDDDQIVSIGRVADSAE